MSVVATPTAHANSSVTEVTHVKMGGYKLWSQLLSSHMSTVVRNNFHKDTLMTDICLLSCYTNLLHVMINFWTKSCR